MEILMNASTSELRAECATAKSLYYRNRNQHGATYLFQMTKKVVKLVEERYDWELLEDMDKTWSTIRAVIQKSGRECSQRVLVLMSKLYAAYQNSVMVVECCSHCVLEIKYNLEQKVFVSLNTFLLASVAKIYKINIDLSKNIKEAYTLLKDHYKADPTARSLPIIQPE